MAIETDILDAMRSHLIAWANDQSPVIPIEFTNDDFDKPSDMIWLRETFLPNGVAGRLYKAAEQRLQGIYQVDLMFPKGAFEDAWRTKAGNLADEFQTDDPFPSGAARVLIKERPSVGPVLVEDASAMIPITIRWTCWTA